MKRLTPILLTVPLLLAGCSSDPGGTIDEAQTTTTQTTDRDAEGYTNVLGGPGEAVTVGGITITVDNITETDSIKVLQSPNPESDISTEIATSGQKFIEVTTTVKNSSDRPWDLTCSEPIAVNLADLDGTIYLPMRDSYAVPGNPECNTMLNPGSEAGMTWRFEVSQGTSPDYFGFSEPEINYENPYFIEIGST